MTTNRNRRELLREKRKALKRRKFFISFIIISGVVVIFGSIALLVKLFSKPVNYETSQGFTVGIPDAPVEVIAFSNYSCGYCKVFSETIEKDLISDYAETGEVYYRFVNLPNNNENSLNAAEASYCAAEQNKLFEYKSFLYTYAAAADGFSMENLNKYATSAGLNTDAFEICMSEDNYAKAYLNDRNYAQAEGIRATPTFLVNGQLVNTSELITTVEALLEN